jgi:acyl carrier protein
MNQQILDGIAAILEVPSVTPETVLANSGGADWDSLAIVCTIALLDEKCSVEVAGSDLAKCETAADVLKLAGVAC